MKFADECVDNFVDYVALCDSLLSLHAKRS